MPLECAICLGDIRQSATGSCSHHFCYECLLEWCKANQTCPKCRHHVREIRLDPEFDLLLTSSSNAPSSSSDKPEQPTPKKQQPSFRLRLSPDHRAGITLTNPQSGPGVLVAYLKPTGATAASNERGLHPLSDTPHPPIAPQSLWICSCLATGRAYECGLRVADVILSINGLPAVSHEAAIAQIEDATASSRDIVCTLLSRGPAAAAEGSEGGAEAEAAGLRLQGRVTHREEEGVTLYALTLLGASHPTSFLPWSPNYTNVTECFYFFFS